MSDRRLIPANDRVAHVSLRGKVEAKEFVLGTHQTCRAAVTDILGSPGGGVVSQLLFGEDFRILEVIDGIAFGTSLKDGYCGYAAAKDLGAATKPSHWVSSPATHRYPSNDMKERTIGPLSFGSRVSVVDIKDRWARLEDESWVPASHLRALGEWMVDLVSAATLLVGTPYFWGGISRNGIDCSGLVQSALFACGQACPRDSDMQMTALGRPLDASEPFQRGDLVFWKGHVGILSDAETLLHANAFHMSTVFEPLAEAKERIAKAGDGDVIAIRRLNRPGE